MLADSFQASALHGLLLSRPPPRPPPSSRATLLLQAYEQRLPLEGVLDYLQTGAIRSKAYGYDCPADQQLDVSWHVGQNAVGGAWSEFMMRPSIEVAVEAVKWAVDNSGIWELKQIRDMVGSCCWGCCGLLWML